MTANVGSKRSGEMPPLSLILLAATGCPDDELSSQSWDDFAASDAPVMDVMTPSNRQLRVEPARTGPSQWGSEILATFCLLFVIFGGLRSKPDAVPTLVALYITGAYWFTASTSFANPAVSIARLFTDTFAGINPTHAPMSIAMQIAGVGVAAIILPRLLTD